MVDPLLWLSLSALTLTVSVAVFLAILVPAIQELNRTARSAERLLDTLNRELPPTLDALKSTSATLSDLTEDVGEGVESAKQIVQQVDRSLEATEQQVTQARIASQSAIAGIRVAWQTFFRFSPEPQTPEASLQKPSEHSLEEQAPKAVDAHSSDIRHPDGAKRTDVGDSQGAGDSQDAVKRAIADELSQINQKLSEM